MSNDKLDRFNPLAKEAAPTLLAFEMDPAEYMPELEGFDMTEAQKIELLQTLWAIMRSFVELGFSGNICEQIFENGAPNTSTEPDAVKSPSAKEMRDER